MSNEYDKKLGIINNRLNKLNKDGQDKADIIALLAIIIYEKDIFLKNKDIKEFITKVFNITYLDYVIESRTSIFSRISKDVYSMNENKIQEVMISLMNFFNIEKSKSKKKKNENDKLDIWLKRL
jgi:hypothetical protein